FSPGRSRSRTPIRARARRTPAIVRGVGRRGRRTRQIPGMETAHRGNSADLRAMNELPARYRHLLGPFWWVTGSSGVGSCSAGLMDPALNTAKWETFMRVGDLRGEQWLLRYEANARGWLPSVGGSDHVALTDSFAFFKTQGVHFYEPIS